MHDTETSRIKSLADAVNKGEYQRPDPKLPLAERIVNFLLWAADRYPNEFVAVRLAYKAVTGVSRIPQDGSTDLTIFKHRSGEVRRFLGKHHSKGLVTQPGMWRATTNDLDYAKTQHRGRIRRLSQASRAFSESTSMINLANIPREEKEVYAQVQASRAISRMLLGANIEERFGLLTPKSAEKVDETTRRLAARNHRA